MSITKNVLLNWYSSMKKKLRKIWMIFDIENWLWKSNFGTFWHLSITSILKFNHFLWVCWFLGKNLSNFVSPVGKLHNPYCHNAQLEIQILIWLYSRSSQLFIFDNINAGVYGSISWQISNKRGDKATKTRLILGFSIPWK